MSAQPSSPRPATVAAHGFILTVGLTEEQARSAGTSLERIMHALEAQLTAMLPTARTRVNYLPAPSSRGSNVRQLHPVPSAHRGEPGLVLDLSRGRARLDGRDVDLSLREFQVLRALIDARGTALTRDDLQARVWEGETAPSSERVVDVTVRRVRSRLGEYAHVIRTVRGVGYRFEPQPGVRVLVPREERPAAV